MSEVTDFLLEAKGLIDSPEKWIKGSFRKNGCYCMLGALLEVVGKDYAWDKACTLIENTLVREKAFSCYMPEFNDAPETTHDDVMKIMDLAIERSKR